MINSFWVTFLRKGGWWLGVGLVLVACAEVSPTPTPILTPLSSTPQVARTPRVAVTPATPPTFAAFLPLLSSGSSPTPTASPSPPPPTDTPLPPTPTDTPTPSWPEPLTGQTLSKLSLHTVTNGDSYIMEFTRRVHPRVMKAADDLGWLTELKRVSPDTMTVGRFTEAEADLQEHWPDTTDPVAAATVYVERFLERYRLNPGVDYWEGWNEFVPVTLARMRWYAQFEATRACLMRDAGLHAAVGGFPMGSPEYAEMEAFIPALEAAHRCGAIFTMHEGVSPIIDCDVGYGLQIPGSPAFPTVKTGYLSFRYRFWYEGYLKPRGLGDVPLVISELAVAGLLPNSPCNGPGGASWKDFSAWWVERGVGATGPEAFINMLRWYDSEMRADSYMVGAALFTAGAPVPNEGWYASDVHDVIIPLAWYAAELR